MMEGAVFCMRRQQWRAAVCVPKKKKKKWAVQALGVWVDSLAGEAERRWQAEEKRRQAGVRAVQCRQLQQRGRRGSARCRGG